MLSLFRNRRHAKKNIWPHSTVFTEQEKCCASAVDSVVPYSIVAVNFHQRWVFFTDF